MQWEGAGQPTVLALVNSLARFLAILVGDKLVWSTHCTRIYQEHQVSGKMVIDFISVGKV